MRWKTTEYSGWGRALRATGDLARPERHAELDAILTDGLCPALGARRSYGDAAQNSGGRAVEMTRLDRLIDFDPATGILTAEAGIALAEILRLFAPRGFIPAVLPGTGHATLGGAIAMDVHGKNHHHAGSFGQHVAEITLRQAGGTVTTRAGDDLFAATLGGLGQTGIIESARLRLTPVQGAMMEVHETRAPHLDAHLDALESSGAEYVVGWLDATARGKRLGRGILEEARIVPLPAAYRPTPAAVPFEAPRAALSRPVVRAFNAAYYARVPRAGRTRLRAMHDFFFPLDRIAGWNRLYGRAGFHQFQCVLPLAARGDLRALLTEIGASGLASPLAVLKRLGPGRAGMLGFPMAGWTLAVDFRDSAAARALIGRLIARTRAAGGRIYLAKDSLAQPQDIAAMYPDLPRWQAIAAAADPQGLLATDLVRRLEMRSLA
ncbi:FAD-binding oxidoreductase [Phaeovulum vinaykumarii]|uniref:Decaprenylphospho-beta-D-ribofuranose 2-oxidase n=1 Tax=Phaeovulum vinaykumarii TaxID=407234 RepID=A0A1N7K0Q9_9RHOB|nr:FAD-binding oxidoreductase [Phaeovulum vinaykumarii]SIS55175.1 decaprenylphospho-beta-D-ribofuranose 2-oxidase [Phaeovulum vinaykumarii]SOB92260.1 decaprenylphospho-beta-D-ribofuranose 2-oxidase [Phaeovulum vinaykumarii]